MEKDFTITNPLIFCQVCGTPNSEENLKCKNCGSPINLLSLSEKEETFLDKIDLDNFYILEFKALKEGLNDLKRELNLLREEIIKLKNDLRSLFNGFFSLKEILEERGLINRYEVEEKWDLKEETSFKIEEQIKNLLAKKDKILSNYKGKNFEGFAKDIDFAIRKFQEQNTVAAEEALKKAYLKDKKNLELLNSLVLLNLQKRDFKKANYYLKKCFKLGGDEETIFLKAWLYSSQEKYRDALELLKRVKYNNINEFLFNILEGNIYFSLKNYGKAIKSFKKALKKEDNLYLNFLLSKAYIFSNNKKNAINYLLKIKDEPFYKEDSLINLFKIYFSLGKRKLALKYVKELLDEYPFKLQNQVLYLLGKEAPFINKIKIKEEIADRILEIGSKLEKEKFQSLRKDFDYLNREIPQEKFFSLSLAFLYLIEKEYDKSIQIVEESLKGNIFEYNKILAYLVYLEGVKGFAKPNFSLKISLDFYSSSKSNLSKGISLIYLSQRIFEVEKDIKKSLLLSKDSIELLPEELKPYGIENFAQIIFSIGRREEGYKILKDLSKNFKEETIFLNLGKMALSMGKEKEAKIHFKFSRKNSKKYSGILFSYWKSLYDQIRCISL